MRWAPDTPDKWAPDLSGPDAWALDSPGGPLTLGAAVEHFLTAKAAEGASPKTIEWYRMVLGRAGRDLGADRALDSLTANELRAWLLTLRETLSPISVAGYVRGIKAFGRWCATEELAEAAALRALRRPRVPHKLVEPLDDAALRRMVDAASVRDRAIVLLMLDTGLRLSELAGLRPSDLRPDGSVKVMGKGARERIVPVGTVARQALVRYLRQANIGDAGAAIFRARGGGALGARGVQQVFNRLKARAGIPGRCSPHTLRHTFARAYLINGGDAFSLQRMLGHSTLDMVKRYVALADTDLAARHRAASPADRLVGGAPTAH
ncbi:MAG: tyrosine-type recombinase/integrase [Thermomicrobiales bacterium]|nr:tyrosine-type recombinase/integrase [Thermomicrobiales bacterium]